MIRALVVVTTLAALGSLSFAATGQWLPAPGCSNDWLMRQDAGVLDCLAARPDLDLRLRGGLRIVGHYCPDGLHPTAPRRCGSGLMASSKEFVDWFLNEPKRFVEVRLFLIDERARIRAALSVPVFARTAKRSRLRSALRRLNGSDAVALFARAPYNPALRLTVDPVTPLARAIGTPGPSGRPGS